MKFRFGSFFTAMLVIASLAHAQYVTTNAQAPMAHPQWVALSQKLTAPPTYGGEFRKVTTSRKRVVGHAETSQPPAQGPQFEFTPGKLQISDRNPDQYVIPATVALDTLSPQIPLKTVRILVNGVERGVINWASSGLAVDTGLKFAIPLASTDAGTLRLSAMIYPADGSSPQVSEWDYDVPSCRVPEIIAYPNPPHSMNTVDFVAQVHGMSKNLMLGSAMLIWSPWPEVFQKFDPNLPRDQWPMLTISTQPVRFENGYLKTSEWGLFPSMKGGYAFLVPTPCGRYAMSNVEQFYTDEAPKPKVPGIEIQVIRQGKGEYLESRVTLQNAPQGGWLESFAEGQLATNSQWYHFSFALPALVEAKDGPQERLFEYLTFEGFVYSIRAQYYIVNSKGYLELVLDDSTARNIPGGTFPCSWCDGGSGGKG